MSITYRGTSLQGANFCLDVIRGLHEPAEVRGKDYVAPGQVGRYHGNREKDIRSILLEGYIRGVGTTAAERQESWHSTTKTILDLMDRSLAPGDLVLAGGIYGLPDTDTWTISARCRNAIGGPIRSGWAFQVWSIELESVDTEWTVEEGS